jgi:hypothetical protein
MGKSFIRAYKEFDIEDVSKHLLIFGELLATCNNCSKLGLALSTRTCPECKTEFRYATFSSSKDKESQMHKIANMTDLIFVDYDDFKRMAGKLKAKDFFK